MRDHFFSDLLVRDGILRKVAFFPPPDPLDPKAPILPIDRLVQNTPAKSTDLTPLIHRTWFVSSLYRDRMRRLRIGGVDLRLLLIALGIIGLILAFMYFSGYLG
jgi:hypothetical protein